MKHFALALALLTAATPAVEAAPYPNFGQDCPHCLPMEIDRLAALLGDDVLRDLVCRLSSQRFTPARLSTALGIPEGQVLRRINTLRGWGLVRLARYDSATTIVEPLPGRGGETLRRWATRYCPSGDACGTPAATSQEEPRTFATRMAGGGAVASPGVLAGKLVTVFGGSGFIGRDLVKRLVAKGARVRVAVRHPDAATSLKSLGEPGQVELMTVDIAAMRLLKPRDPETVDAPKLYDNSDKRGIFNAILGADMVVNLIGVHTETEGNHFRDANFHGARQVAMIVSRAEISQFVHVSALGATTESASIYAQTKAVGENIVRATHPPVTIVRPSIVFGPGDRFFTSIAEFSRFSLLLPVFADDETLFQPVYVGDVSEAIVRILEDPATEGKIYELGGPRKMNLRKMYSLVMRETQRQRLLVPLPEWVGDIHGALLEGLPGTLLTRDQVSLMQNDDVVHPGALGLADLGITPTPIEKVLHKYLGKGKKPDKSEPHY